MRRHGLAVNPLADVQMPKAERKLPVVLTLKQVEELLALPLTLPKEKQAPAWMPARGMSPVGADASCPYVQSASR